MPITAIYKLCPGLQALNALSTCEQRRDAVSGHLQEPQIVSFSQRESVTPELPLPKGTKPGTT